VKKKEVAPPLQGKKKTKSFSYISAIKEGKNDCLIHTGKGEDLEKKGYLLISLSRRGVVVE